MTEWERIRANEFAFPESGSVEDLVAELAGMLTSPDPVTRDELAFSALATWVDDGTVPDGRLRPLGDLMATRFDHPEIQTRTFAPLVLDVIVSSRGVCEPRWVDAFAHWYASERDLRGHDPELGWLHAVAHGADLLGDLGRHTSVSSRRMLDLAATRMLAATDFVWRDQEDDRLAHAVTKVLADQRLSADDAVAWLAPAADALAAGEPGPMPAQASNTLRTLRMVYLLVDRGVRVGPEDVAAVPHRTRVLDRLAAVLHPATPWMW